jgi:hypothetical protein
VELEPYGSQISPSTRRTLASNAVHELADHAFGAEISAQLGEGDAAWHEDRALRFGAFIGAVFDSSDLVELKLYRELTTTPPCSQALFATARQLAASLPGLRPHFASVAVNAHGASERIYLVCEEGLRLLDLEPFMRANGLADRLPRLIDTITAVTDGPMFVPPRGALIGLRNSFCGIELKIDLLGDALRAADAAVVQRIRHLLAERPTSLQPFEQLIHAVESVQELPARPAAVGVSCDARSDPAVNVYLRT